MLISISKAKAKTLYYRGYEIYAFVEGMPADCSTVRKFYACRKMDDTDFDYKLNRWKETQLLAGERLTYFVKERAVSVRFVGREYEVKDFNTGVIIGRVAGDARLAFYLVQSYLYLQYPKSVNGLIQAAYKVNHKRMLQHG